MSNRPKIFIIDDDPDICLILSRYFQKEGFDASSTSNGKDGIAYLKRFGADVVLCDFRLPDYNGIEILQKIKIIDPNIHVIIVTGYSDVRTAVEALKKGAFEYVTKPLYPDEILMTVKSALKAKSKPLPLPETPANSNGSSSELEYIRGVSQAAQKVQRHIELIAPTDMSVIIFGETGTGKEFVARSIHDQSKRKDQPFVAIDCGALPIELAGSELFGHVKGAFTGAIADKRGCFELADGGTLFLDEISNLSYENQVKMLRVLQEKVIKRVGGIKDIPVNVRILVATNYNLIDAVKAGDFREDIFHRINEFNIDIAPLRNRPEDIELFAVHFLKSANAQLHKNVEGFDMMAMSHLKNYYWHGNLRELRNVVKRAVLLCSDEFILPHHLPHEITEPFVRDNAQINISFGGMMPGSLKEVAEASEKKAIIEVLKKTNNNKTKTATILKVDRKTLYNKINAYHIDL
jgi:two-component system, NtrC family, response regulator HydG